VGSNCPAGSSSESRPGRAFLPDADLIILDEPTSALDADAERRLMETFRALTVGRTAIMISHRLSTVRTADAVAVLAGGRVVELGSHEELMKAGGRYADPVHDAGQAVSVADALSASRIVPRRGDVGSRLGGRRRAIRARRDG